MASRHWTWLAWPLGSLPLLMLLFAVFSGGLGPDPAEILVEDLGWWGLVLLLGSLAMRPASQIFSVPGFVVWRRTLGLWSFVYLSLHFLAWATLFLGWNLLYLAEELSRRPYIVVGVLAWLCLWPLAVTSTRASRRRLGKRWLKLHRLVFPAVLLGLLHQSWVQKSGYGETLVFALVLGSLLIYRARRDHGFSPRFRKAAGDSDSLHGNVAVHRSETV